MKALSCEGLEFGGEDSAEEGKCTMMSNAHFFPTWQSFEELL